MEIKTKNTIRKIAAIGTGLLMTATTFGAAFAVDLGDYPAPFVANNQWANKIVVGSGASGAGAAADLAGAVEIATTLAQQVTATVATATVSGGKEKEVDMNTPLQTDFGSALKDEDLAGFQDAILSIDIGSDEDYDVHDELQLGSSTPVVETGTTADNPDEDYGDKVFLSVASGDIDYLYVFDDALDAGNYIANASTDTPFELTFLGKKLTITDVNAAGTGITAQVGEEHFMNVGDSVTVLGKVVKLLNVGSSSTATVVVSVDGVTETVSTTAETVGGLKVKAKDAFYSETKADSSATIIVGEDATKAYVNGDEYIGQPKTGYDWQWVLAGLNGGGPTIGIENAKSWDGADEVFYEGKEIALPDNYVKIKLGALTVDKWQKYTFTIETEELYNVAGTQTDPSESVIRIVCAGGNNDGFDVGGNLTDVIYLATSGTGSTAGQANIYWEDSDDGNHGKFYGAAAVGTGVDTGVDFEFDDTTNIPLLATANASASDDVTYTIDMAQDIKILVDLTANVTSYLGAVDGDATAGDLLIGSSNTDVSTWDGNTLTQDGVRILNVEDNLDGDKFILELPEADYGDFEAKVLISGPGTTTVSSAASGSLASVQTTFVDNEISDKTATNLILIGGPAVNLLTAEAVGLTGLTEGAPALTALGIAADQATIKYIANAFSGSKVALIVAGDKAIDTRNAANVLKDFSTYKTSLTGKTQVIVTKTGTAIQVAAPTVAAA